MKIQAKIFGISLVCLLILGGLGAWYVASMIKPEQLIKVLASSVKNATGRDLKISGPISLNLFPKITISAEQLSLSNDSWATSADMLTLKRMDINIKIFPLLSKRIEIHQVELSGLEVFLQKNAAGKVNWDMNIDPPSSSLPLVSSQATSTHDESGITMGNISVTNATIHYRNASGQDSLYQIKRLSSIESSKKTSILLDMDYQGLVLSLAGKTDSISGLIKHWDVSPSQFAFDLKLGVSGKSMMIQGEVIKSPKSLPIVDLRLTSDAFDWPSVGGTPNIPIQGSTNLLNKSSQSSKVQLANKKPSSPYLLSDEILPFDVLPKAKGKIVIKITELGLPKRKPLQNLSAIVQMNDSSIDIPQLMFQMGKGQADIQLGFSALGSASPVITSKGFTKDFTLEDLLARIDPSSKVSGGNMKLAFDLKMTGKSLHQMASNANGKIQLDISQAKIGSNFLNDGGELVITLLDAINPLRKKTAENMLECAVAYLPINSGQINIANTIGIETDRLNVVLAGSINLKTEGVNLTIEPREKSGLTSGLDLAGLVKVGGTLSNPKAMVNQAGVVSSAVSIGLGFLTGGASILAENAKSLSSKSQPCREALHPWADIYPGMQ
ncbi:AsmA family protein [Polynucleobacter antarcticus]|uniref:AsmA domain-containing protein n=1 Tax=Polynucleobacter antarcticus TaxID=1743162 RepID=A0A6M9PIP7_9BURK|nr:AsmA family protein [Polynucleobacter antarcticus]QKM62034.1 hypothetical protein DCO16_02430 [Polynucleobacter antarcticus]